MRDSWDSFFMRVAREVATRATCDRKHVGAIIVRDNNIIATGYNGSIPKMEHCNEVGHIVIDGSCVRTTHAEQNALCQAAKRGVALQDSTAYVTCEPCWTCFKLLITSGVTRIVFVDPYNSEDSTLKGKKLEVVRKLGIRYEEFQEKLKHQKPPEETGG